MPYNNSHWLHRLANYVYLGYVIFLSILWMFVNYGGKGIEPYEGSGIRWFLITIPLFVYLSLNFLLLLTRPRVDKNPIIIFLLLYTISVLLISVIHMDIKHISEIIRWTFPVMFVIHFKTYMPLNVLNALYILSIVIIIFTFNPIDSDYGFLPGQTTTNLHQGLWWRISIWKYITPPYSAAFSVIVFFANYFLNKGMSRFVFYFFSLYFLLLSASRTGYLVFFICYSVIIFNKYYKFKYRKFYILIPIISVVFIFLLQFFADLIPLLGIENEFLNSAILRNNDSTGDASNLSSRLLIILEHIRLVQESGISGFFGIGSDIYASPAWTSNGGELGGTADSYVSHLIARDGVFIILLISSFAFLFVESMKSKNILAYVVLLALLLYTIGYGAWLNYTSPVFVIFFGFIYQVNSKNMRGQPDFNK